MALVVIGHWLVSAVTYRDGLFGNDNPLAVMPWTQWLTLAFQVVPVFFLVGGYASATSWTRWRDAGGAYGVDWVRQRLGAILGPTAAYVALALAMVAVLDLAGVGSSPLSFGGWAVAMHLWFVPIYLVVVALTPVAVAAQQRWGLLVPAALALALVATDVAERTMHLPGVGAVNYVLCWGAVYQLGICWRSGALGGWRALAMAVAASVVLTLFLALGCYPVSMVGVPGAAVQNSNPPSPALLSLAAAQAGLLVAVAPTVTRWLQRSPWRRFLSVANHNVMALYLWQMIPVVIVALAGYPTGLLPQPAPGTATWWLFRLGWLAILAVVLAAEMAMLRLARSVLDRPLPTIGFFLPGWSAPPLLVLGLTIVTVALSRLAVEGFAPHGDFPIVYSLLFASAVALLSLAPSRKSSSHRCALRHLRARYSVRRPSFWR